MKKLLLVAALGLSSLATLPSQAATVTGNFDVTINLTSACRLTTLPGNITLAYTSFGAAPTPVTSSFAVQCTNTLPYTMSIGAANSTIAALDLNYDLVLRNAADSADVTGPQIAAVAATNYLIKASMTAGQQGACATAICSGTANRVLTITY